MLSIPGALLQDLVSMAMASPWVVLLDVDLDGSEHLRLAFNPEDVTYGGNVYSASSGEPQVVALTKDASMPTFGLNLNHMDRDITPYLRQSGGLEGQDLTIVIVNTDRLAADYSALTTVYEIKGHSDTEESVAFELGGPNLYHDSFPRRRVLALICEVEFDGDDGLCGYAGAETECDHTLARCRELNNATRFGGSPGSRAQALKVVTV